MLRPKLLQLVRQWWREWGIIDLLSFLGGTVTALIYVGIMNTFDSNSPVHSFLPNIATEILGVWLSVRIIDRIIRQRDTFHAVRKEITSEFDFIESELSRFPQMPYEWRLTSTEERLSGFESVLPSFTKYLSPDEQDLLKSCFTHAWLSLAVCGKYFDDKSAIREAELEIKSVCVDINACREQAYSILWRCLTSFEAKAIGEPVEATTPKSVFSDVLQNSSHCLSPDERDLWRQLDEFLNEKEVLTIEELSSIKIGLESLNRSIYYSDRRWYRVGEDICDAITNGQPEAVITQKAISLPSLVESELNQLPASLYSLAEAYAKLVTQFTARSQEVRTSNSRFIACVDALRANISTETTIIRQIGGN